MLRSILEISSRNAYARLSPLSVPILSTSNVTEMRLRPMSEARCKIDGKWQIAPIKNKVGKLLQKMNAAMTNKDLASILDASSSLNSIP